MKTTNVNKILRYFNEANKSEEDLVLRLEITNATNLMYNLTPHINKQLPLIKLHSFFLSAVSNSTSHYRITFHMSTYFENLRETSFKENNHNANGKANVLILLLIFMYVLQVDYVVL